MQTHWTHAMKALALSLILLLCAPLLHATVVMELAFEELVAESAFIFTGEVLDVAVSSHNDLVYSTVTFAVEQQIKGRHSAPTLDLRFVGGIDDTRQLDVAGQFIPAVGDRGLYFVNAPDRHQVNPLTGWSQGYFPLLEKTNGTWLDLRNHPAYSRI